MTEFTIRAGRIEDADFLGKVVAGALGEELCTGLAGGSDRINLVSEMFSKLAAEEESQYSYRNALVAIDERGERIGAIIGYDGSALKRLRKAFVREAKAMLNWKIPEDEMKDEAEPTEIYLDSLFIVPEQRGKGVGSRLIEAMGEHLKESGKPLGLLVEPENEKAKRTYERLGFVETGVNNAFPKKMIHMQKKM